MERPSPATLGVMPWPESALTDDEKIVTKFRPHWKLLFVPFLWFIAAVVAIGLIFSIIPGGGWGDAIPTLLVLAAVVVLVIKPLVDWWFTLYVLTTERLITRRGLIARRGIEIPLENITNVNFSQTIIERALGAGDLIVESAGETGRSEFTNIPHPDEFQALLYKIREERSRTLADTGSSPTPTQLDATERLHKLSELHRSGVISDAEYEEKRQKLLDEI